MESWNEEAFVMGQIVTQTAPEYEEYYFKASLSLDNKKYIVDRKEYNWNMWFVAIGGFSLMVKKTFASFVAPFTDKMFINAVLGSVFMMKKNRDPET